MFPSFLFSFLGRNLYQTAANAYVSPIAKNSYDGKKNIRDPVGELFSTISIVLPLTL